MYVWMLRADFVRARTYEGVKVDTCVCMRGSEIHVVVVLVGKGGGVGEEWTRH